MVRLRSIVRKYKNVQHGVIDFHNKIVLSMSPKSMVRIQENLVVDVFEVLSAQGRVYSTTYKEYLMLLIRREKILLGC